MTASHSLGVKMEPCKERRGSCLVLCLSGQAPGHCQLSEDPAGGGVVGREPLEQACQSPPLVSEYSDLPLEIIEFGLDFTTVMLNWASGLEGWPIWEWSRKCMQADIAPCALVSESKSKASLLRTLRLEQKTRP